MPPVAPRTATRATISPRLPTTLTQLLENSRPSSSGDFNTPVEAPLSMALLSSSGDFARRAVWPPPSTGALFQARESCTHPPLQEPFSSCDDVHVIFVLKCHKPFVTIFFGSVYFSFRMPHLPYCFCCVCVHLEYCLLSSAFLIVYFVTVSMRRSSNF